MSIGKAIRLCRTQRSLSQSELASSAGISVSYLSLIERNQRDPTLSTVVSISAALNISMVLLTYLATSNRDIDALGSELCEKLSYAALQAMQQNESADHATP